MLLGEAGEEKAQRISEAQKAQRALEKKMKKAGLA